MMVRIRHSLGAFSFIKKRRQSNDSGSSAFAWVLLRVGNINILEAIGSLSKNGEQGRRSSLFALIQEKKECS
jgi:hypothetical protein